MWLDVSKAQSLLLTPNSTSPVLVNYVVGGYKHSSITNSTILSSSIISGAPTIQTLTNSFLGFTVNNGPALMLLSSAGNLSIGSTSPTERLDIKNGRIRFTGQKAANQPSGYVFTNNNNTVAFRMEMKDDNHLWLTDGTNTDNFTMNVNTGNVGINTPPSTETLTISGNVHNTQLENTESAVTQVLATANGDLVKAETSKVEITPWNYTRFGGIGNNNFIIITGFGYYTTSSSMAISAPVHLPNGAQLKSMKVKVVDNSVANYLRFDLIGVETASSSYIGNITTKASTTNTSVIELSNSLNHTTDCSSQFYILTVSALKTSDDSSALTDSNLKIGTLTITYSY